MEFILKVELSQLYDLVNQLSIPELERLENYILHELLPQKKKVHAEEKKRQFGFAKGMISYVAPDFDETPPGFEEYMPSEK